MERGDFAHLVGCSYLWHGQLGEPVPHEEVSLIVLAPTVNDALRDRLSYPRVWRCAWNWRRTQAKNSIRTSRRSKTKCARIVADVPQEEWDRLPADLTDHLDHYIYGLP